MTNLEVKRGDDFYEKWRLKAEIKMKSKSIDNIEKRCNEVTKIVNEIGRGWCKNNIKCELFVINKSWRNDINGSMILKLNHWSGVDVKACKNKINTWQEYWDRADNWFNRNKGQWFGDYLFYPLFENKLISYAKMVANIVNKECKILKDLIFIEILHKISNEHIRFKQTRSQSLLIDQSLVQSYKLRNLFITIAKLNNIEWEIPGIKKSARLYRETWRHCVAKIYNFKLKQYQHFIGNKKSVNNNNNINIKRSNNENKNIINNIPIYNISPIKPLNYILPIYRPPTTFIYTCTPMIRNNNIPSNNNNIIITSNNNNNNNNIINNITNNNNNNPLNNLPLYNVVSIPYGPITSQSIPNYSRQYRYSPY